LTNTYQPPASESNAIEAEQALLGAMLINNDALPLLIERLKPHHFFEPVHARIYEAACTLIGEGKPAHALTLAPFFREDATLKDVGGVTYLARLISSAVTILNCPAYAELIIECWIKRQTSAVLADLDSVIHQPGEDPAAVRIKAALARILELSEPQQAGGRRAISKAADVLTEDLNATFQNRERPIKRGIYTGSADLDRVLGGFERTAYYVIGSRPSMGKTTFATSLTLRSARSGAGVVYFSLEMTAKSLAERALSDLAWSATTRIPYQDIHQHRLTDSQFERVMQTRHLLTGLPFIIDERPRLTMAAIKAASMREKVRLENQGKTLDIVVIDHMGLVAPSDAYRGNKVAETEETSGECKALAKDLNCAVIALLQLNRQVEGREEKRPTLSDLRWSGAIEQDADAVGFIYRPAYYLERTKHDGQAEADRVAALEAVKDKLEFIIAKNREGPCCIIEFKCDMACSAVRPHDFRHPLPGDDEPMFI
jgi:replicative DNA helicase